MKAFKRVLSMVAVIACVAVAAAVAFDPPRPCEKCGGQLAAHPRNSSVLECKSCDFMVHTSHWSQRNRWGLVD